VSSTNDLSNDLLAPSRGPELRVSDLGRGAPRSVCLIGPGWQFTSGVSYYTCRLANAFAEHNQTSVIQLRHLVPRRLYPGRRRIGKTASSLRYDPRIAVLSGIDWWWGTSILRAISFLRRVQPEVVVLEWWTAATLHTYLVLAVAARLNGSKLVVEMHESQDPGEAKYQILRSYAGLGLRLLFRITNGLLVHSAADREHFRRMFGLGKLPIATAPHGPYDQFCALTETAAEGDAGADRVREAPRSAINLLSFGLIRPYKGVQDLLCAFARLTDLELSRFWLTVVGETWEDDSISDLIAEHRHSNRITFLNDYVPDSTVAAAFEHADIVILPYRRSSSSGVLHIAMSYGLPVVLTRVGGLPEAAEGYQGAVFVSPNNIESLREGILQAATLVGERFPDPRTWSHVVDAVLSVSGVVKASSPGLASERR